jgi:hypothetical protein
MTDTAFFISFQIRAELFALERDQEEIVAAMGALVSQYFVLV